MIEKLKKIFSVKNRKIIYGVSAVMIILGAVGGFVADSQIREDNWQVMVLLRVFLFFVALLGVISCFLEEIFSKFLDKPVSIVMYVILTIMLCVAFGFFIRLSIEDLTSKPVNYTGSCAIVERQGKRNKYQNIYLTGLDRKLLSIDSTAYRALGGKGEINREYLCTKDVDLTFLKGTGTIIRISY